ncbi:HesB/YadR/YfhF family protein [Paenibacillus typhae]|uniref:HesB/YadR/YfhF family protein n=1 Tax=Paenibacillus typhae TaxID=1174501 RepID=UPI001C8D9F5A|nr:HesB/YadR/YfhF family protein [Paenibacillus typhae]MBY0009900.1 HesB/YadR/YfhF family protein [Paenibacillus typhae]
MDMTISPEAAAWFKKELNLKNGDSIRLFPRYSSGGGLHPGFSLGIATEPPARPAAEAEQEGLIFYMEEQDLWYMEGYSLSINYVAAEDDIEYVYQPLSAAGQAKE